MTLVLEIPAETENQLREAAARRGRSVEEFILDAARHEAMQTPYYPLDEAARSLSVSRAFLRESVENGALVGEIYEDEIYILADEKFETLRQQQAETQQDLIEMARINSALGLYDN